MGSADTKRIFRVDFCPTLPKLSQDRVRFGLLCSYTSQEQGSGIKTDPRLEFVGLSETDKIESELLGSNSVS